MKRLNHQLKQLCRRNRDGSHGTQATRERLLALSANQLHNLGFRRMNVRSLKPKHVDALVAAWQNEHASPGTLKNRMATLRWWAEKVDKRNVIARDNAHYGIARRELVSDESKSFELDERVLDKIPSAHIRASLRLQSEFGLRREEAIKFIPAFADQGDRIRLKASWTKGGRARVIPVTTASQRRLIHDLHQLAGKGSLIPAHRSYVKQLRQYERLSRLAGLSKLHGLRHAYAQRRYAELSGFPCPYKDGPKRSEMSDSQRLADRAARLQISAELGHGRTAITDVYLGR